LVRLGGINITTREYVYPDNANKCDKYICPDCEEEIILCKVSIRVPYYRHKNDSNERECNRYNNPSESQIHKEGKIIMKELLESNIIIYINIIDLMKMILNIMIISLIMDIMINGLLV
jgi:competence CoiA-like predicted nuclease